MLINIFISYSHKDKKLREKLDAHLSNLRNQGLIDTWHDGDITPGTEWEQQIIEQLTTAQIILLLVSADFLASTFCTSIELKQAIARHDAHQACVIPIILRSTDWADALFAKLQVLPTGAKPVTSWAQQDEAFTNIAKGIKRAIDTGSLSIGVKSKEAQKLLPGQTTSDATILGSGLYGEDDPGSHESTNLDQNRDAVEPSDPSDHSQETHYPILQPKSPGRIESHSPSIPVTQMNEVFLPSPFPALPNGASHRRYSILSGRRILLGMLVFLILLVMVAGGSWLAHQVVVQPRTATTSILMASPTADTTSNVVVKTANATVDGQSESILTDVKGMTLYYFKPDVLHKVACTTGCTDTWPPLLFKGTGTVSTDTKLPGTLTTDNTSNGNQVVYNGYYLYTYSGDSDPGQANGQEIGNKWYVVTPDLK